ncbi:hypothetical protein TPA0910_87930 [Streptomyces hygroscopicus subsp. sporocinereus]|uniref:Uncharacterized protein n=1 Tax=Streptomyces hygroscopicus TaxID=1912 RepID=A0ABQ3UFI9_STRHY|nr:hypothetical protein [Streptomyces hygroscopicus]GHJ34360.1 hypothetical protein TPA0910_87930 [Streptomyces hygroscopicus]
MLAERPIYVLAVANGTIQGGVPWMIDVIVFHQYYEHPDGTRELNFITREAIAFQRTVPLQIPFPTDPTTDDEGASDGEEQEVRTVEEDERSPQHEDGPEEDEQQAVRAAREEEIPGGRPASRSQRAGAGIAAWLTGREEGRSRGGAPEVPEPEEDRPQGKEVGP